MATKSLRKINDEIEELCLYGIDVPDESEDNYQEVDDNYLEEALNKLDMERHEKIEQIGLFRIDQKSKIQEIKNEIKRLKKWEKQLTKRGEWLDNYCMFEMIRAGISQVIGKFVKVSVNKSPISANVKMKDGTKNPDIENIDPKYVKEVIEYKVDTRKAIADYKKSKRPIRGITFNKENTHLRIK